MAILQLFLVWAVTGKLAYLNTTSSPAGLSYTNVQGYIGSLATTVINTTSSKQTFTYQALGQTLGNESYALSTAGTAGTAPSATRIPPPNLYSNGSFMTYNGLSLYKHSNFNFAQGQSISITVAPGGFYEGLCYGNSVTDIFMLRNNGANHNLLFYSNGSILSSGRMSNVSVSYDIDRMLCRSGKIFMRYQAYMEIFAMDTVMASLFYKPTSNQTINQTDMDAQTNGIFAYNDNKILFVYNHSSPIPYPLISSFTHTSFIAGIKIMPPCYIIFADYNNLYQYDYEINTTINTISLNITGPQSIVAVDQYTLVITKDLNNTPYMTNAIYYYSVDPSYLLANGTTTCYPTYVPDTNNGLYCVKNNSNFTIPVPTAPIIAPVTVVPNVTANTTTPLADPVIEKDVEDVIKDTFKELKGTYNNTVAFNAASSVLMVSSIKLSPQFLLSLWLVFDDISFYAYHAKEYPYVVQFFFSKIEIIVRDRLDPWFLQVVDALNASTPYGMENNVRMKEYLAIPSLDSEDIFFTRSFLENYRNSIYFTALIFLLLKLLQLLSCRFRENCKCFNYFYKFAVRNSQWWLALASIVEGYASKAAFDFGVQTILPSSSQILDKCNLAICFLAYFILFFYVIVFYPMIFTTKTRKNAKMVLMPCKYDFYSYFYQPCLILIRILIRSFIHSFFLSDYTLQILLLFIFDIFSLGVCIKMRRFFYNMIIFYFYLVYMAAFASFDLFFYLETISILPSDTKRELFSFIMIAAMIGSSLLISLAFFVLFVVVIGKFISRNVSKIFDSSAATRDRKSKLAAKKSQFVKQRGTIVQQIGPKMATIKMTQKILQKVVNLGSSTTRKQNLQSIIDSKTSAHIKMKRSLKCSNKQQMLASRSLKIKDSKNNNTGYL